MDLKKVPEIAPRGEPRRGTRFLSAFGLLSGHPAPRSARTGASGSRFSVFGAELQKVLFIGPFWEHFAVFWSPFTGHYHFLVFFLEIHF